MKAPQLKKINEWLDVITKLIIIIGVPWSLFQYIATSNKERHDRQEQVYDALDHDYKEWELLCLLHPELDIADVPDSISTTLNAEQQKQEVIIFTILFSTFEHAFLKYRDSDDEFRQRQWSGWRDYIMSYCKRKNFRRAWKLSGSTYDVDFQKFMSDCIARPV